MIGGGWVVVVIRLVMVAEEISINWGDVACSTEVRLRVHVASGLQLLGIGGGCDLLLVSARCSWWASSNESMDVQRRKGFSSFSRYVQTHHERGSF